MKQTIRLILAPLASIRLTVLLLAAGMVLVFVGTLAQQHNDIHTVLKTYFHTLVIFPGGWPIPLPGGYLIGGLFLINLLAAHIIHFQLSWKRLGIILIHAGLVVLLLSELATSLWAVESQMSITQGQTRNYTESIRQAELALTTPSDQPGLDQVIAIPATHWRSGQVIRLQNPDHPLINAPPLEIGIERYYPNSQILGPAQAQAMNLKPDASQGVGTQLVAQPLPPNRDHNRFDVPSAIISLRTTGPQSTLLGTWLVSMHLINTQPVTVGDRTYHLALRPRRDYKPYQLTLLQFKHERHHGVDVPKSFSSLVRLVDAPHQVDRQVLIYMNNPLRYAGETFYQAGFANEDQTTILQVVRNPSWLAPYLATVLVGSGLLFHFLMHLFGFLRRRS